MSNTEFGWEPLLHTDSPTGCPLKAALFTTYDRAEERLLAEHLLPLFLKLSREPDGEGAERQFFLLELDRRLKQLHDKIVVISSTVREEPGETDEGETGTYGWIWRSIRHLTVGSRRNAVQHAKLWLLHWGAADGKGVEYLEIVVSSANLTLAAFKGQVQSAWRACVELRPEGSKARLREWGVLPDFLRELADSAGDASRAAPFLEALRRAECPGGLSFVASVPGTHTWQALRLTPWGAAGLRRITPPGRGRVCVSILSPYVGSWKEDALRRWCSAFDGSPDRVKLVWIDKHHPWAVAGRWLLPIATLKTLTKAGATILHLRREPNDPEESDTFHEDHQQADDRWSHAKVYAFRRGTSRRVLVTSANFSSAAWGSETREGPLRIENFELGVCLDGGAWPLFESLSEFENMKDAATVLETANRAAQAIAWAQAVWNGRSVAIKCRCEADQTLHGDIRAGPRKRLISAWKVEPDRRRRSAMVPWADAKFPPSVARLTCGDSTVNIPIFDARPALARENTVPPEVDESAAETMRDELLFEQYGGHIPADLDIEQPIERTKEQGSAAGEPSDGDGNSPQGAGKRDSFDVRAIVLARHHLRVVDNWADQVRCLATSGAAEFERQVLRRDGEMLARAFQRQAERDGKKDGIGANLAAEELALRLRNFPEE